MYLFTGELKSLMANYKATTTTNTARFQLHTPDPKRAAAQRHTDTC